MISDPIHFPTGTETPFPIIRYASLSLPAKINLSGTPREGARIPRDTFASEDIKQRGIERYGTKLAEARYYKADLDGQNVYLTFYHAADGSIADYFGY